MMLRFGRAIAVGPCFLAGLALAPACGDAGPPGGEGGAAGASAGSGAPELTGFLATDRLGELPEALSEFGLLDREGQGLLPEGVHAYVPRFVLWTNGSEKDRLISVPPGTRIDTRESEWVFPPGTLFFKTFSYRNADGEKVPTETRVIQLLADDEVAYAAYLWDAEGNDAKRLEGRRVERASVEVEGEQFDHEIPSILQCRTCHESSFDVVLGFDRERLDDRLDGHDRTQLAELFGAGILSHEVSPDPTQVDPDETTEDVLGYFEGNCVHCHNGGPAENAAFDLRRPVAVENLVGVQTTSELLHGVRVVAGNPEDSVLFQALIADREDPDLKPMPPLGVQRADRQAEALVEAWIRGLD